MSRFRRAKSVQNLPGLDICTATPDLFGSAPMYEIRGGDSNYYRYYIDGSYLGTTRDWDLGDIPWPDPFNWNEEQWTCGVRASSTGATLWARTGYLSGGTGHWQIRKNSNQYWSSNGVLNLVLDSQLVGGTLICLP